MSSEFRIENSCYCHKADAWCTRTTSISNCSMLTCERDCVCVCVCVCVRVLQNAEYKCAPRTRMLSRSSLDGKVNPFVQAHRGIMEFDEHILCRQLAARSRHGVASDGACFELAVALRARQIGLRDRCVRQRRQCSDAARCMKAKIPPHGRMCTPSCSPGTQRPAAQR